MHDFSRRQALGGLGSSLLIFTSASGAMVQGDAGVGKLKSFFVQTVGKAKLERRSIAEQQLSDVTSLSTRTLLVEIAAIGVLVRTGSTSDAVRKGYTRTSKNAVDLAEREFSNVAWAHALTGAWHYEACRRSSVGAALMGASRKDGDRHFRLATKLDPNDGGIRLAQAVSLLGDDGKKHATTALALSKASEMGRGSAYAKAVSDWSAALAALLSSGKTNEAEALALKIF